MFGTNHKKGEKGLQISSNLLTAFANILLTGHPLRHGNRGYFSSKNLLPELPSDLH